MTFILCIRTKIKTSFHPNNMQFYVYKNELSDPIRTVSKSYISDLLRFMISNNTYLLYYTISRRKLLGREIP